MAKIGIYEKDYTASSTARGTTSIVFIPGFRGVSSDTSAAREAKFADYGVPTLVTTVSDFKEKFGETAYTYTDTSNASNDFTDLAWLMAYHCLEEGLEVLYEACGTSATATKADIKAIIATESFWTALKDKSKYDIRFLTSGGYLTVEDTGISFMMDCASARGDCTALLDHNSIGSLTSAQRTATAIREKFTSIITKSTAAGKYCAAFTPWCYFNFDGESSTDITTGLTNYVEYPATFAYLMAYANSVQSNSEYMAAAGVVRGQIPNIVAPTIEWGDADKDILQGDLDDDDMGTGELAINPIMKVGTYGNIVYGNRTCLVSDGLKATSFLNVRNLVSTLRKLMYATARKLTFEQNDDVLWVRFKSYITPTLDSMQTGNGINGYKMTKVASTKKATLNAVIRIIPIEPVEYFNLTVEMTDSLDTVTETA